MRKFVNNLLDYIIISILIIISGAVIYQQYNQEFLIISLILFIIIYLIRSKKYNINKTNIIFLFVIIIALGLNYLLNISDSSLTKYISYIIRFLISILIIGMIKFNSFRIKYCNIIVSLSLMSLIFYTIIILNKSFAYNFPVIQDFAGSYFGNAILYAYRLPIVSNYRNNSIFWEPGAFQAILNVALFFELFFEKNNNIKRYIYIITIITTFSTTGYILLLLNILIYIIRRKNNISKIYLSMIIIIFILFSSLGSVIINKFDQENLSYSRRNVDFLADIDISVETTFNLIIGGGPSKYLEDFPIKISSYGMMGTSSSNSITSTLAQFGLIFFILFLLFYFSNLSIITNNSFHSIVLIIGFCIIFATENFIFSPLFLSIAAYKNNFIKKRNNEKVGE